jgi:hypothetical protein
VRNHVCLPLQCNAVHIESHSYGQSASYFLRALRTLHSSLGFGDPPHFVGTLRFLRGNSYMWHVHVVNLQEVYD